MSVRVLITNVGRRGYLVDYLKKITAYSVQVFVSDCDPTASGLFTNNDGHFILPRPVDDPEQYVQRLLDTCLSNNIGVIVPVIDPEIDILSRYRDRFAENNIFVSVSDANVLNICYDKREMNRFLLENNFSIPQTYYSMEHFFEALTNNEVSFPVIVKPIFGSGSVSTYKVGSLNEVQALFQEGHMIQAFVNGQEYGCDIFNTRDGVPVRCVLKKKLAMRSGETDKALTVKDPAMQQEMIRLGIALGHIANLDCDVIEKDGAYYIIDLNPRFGGGYPATHAAGVNLLELVLDMSEGKPIKPDFDTYQDHLLVMKEVSVRTAKVDAL